MKLLRRLSLTLNVSPSLRARSSVLSKTARRWLWLFLLFCLVGCSGVQPLAEGRAAVDDRHQRPPTAAWQSGEGSADGRLSGNGKALSEGTEPATVLYSQNPLPLRREVATACARSRAANDRRFLRSLVADLYFSGVDPAVATEALLLGECGTLPEILTEMVAQGGPASGDAVSARARAVAGPGSARRIDAAVTAGLARYASKPDAETVPVSDPPPAYGMLYFPSVGEGARIDTSMALNQLYENGIPGYGIYTFVLPGRGLPPASGASAARLRELLRIIETYVATTENEGDGPSAEAHAFLIPVNAAKLDEPLIDQIAVDLSRHMHRQFSQSLRLEGQARLAAHLEKGDGPFLITTLEPRLLSSDPSAFRLVADLSRLGPEHLYGIVDAYDRPIPSGASGRPESLRLIRERLLNLPLLPADALDNRGEQPNWLFSLGQIGDRSTVRRQRVTELARQIEQTNI
ncbi:hypothetical protein [Thiobaca trueperi]|uniref:Uncharacterized protein n=1 Tax=Thiobaca trueperi TaxID=127458 RepID=A0A4R3MXH3_9GAMM|nr:hypothetical protein [Thiobaca trueperi]TCT21308.1 hypothetical protein EDC35_104163 [Thiobaca trueperi]